MCRCVQKANAHLERDNRNTRLVVAETFNLTAGVEGRRLLVATEKIDSTKRGRAMPVFATFCPFCGDRFEKDTL